MQPELLSEISAYVTFLLKDTLPPTLYFHNMQHTLDVVNGTREIGLKSGLSPNEMVIAEAAAWLHDTGYLHKYQGHEEESIRIAAVFLAGREISVDELSLLVGCIKATKYPQQPKSLLEQVVCDADFYHFTLPDYPLKANSLRKEWEHYLHKDYSNSAWNTENCNILSTHIYFTNYGKTVLQALKAQNLAVIQSYCDD